MVMIQATIFCWLDIILAIPNVSVNIYASVKAVATDIKMRGSRS